MLVNKIPCIGYIYFEFFIRCNKSIRWSKKILFGTKEIIDISCTRLGILCCFPLEKYLFSAVSVQIHAGSYKTKMVDRFMEKKKNFPPAVIQFDVHARN